MNTEYSTIELTKQVEEALQGGKFTMPADGVLFGEKYSRFRPFLVINQVRRPKKGVNTRKAGWTKEEKNWAIFESPEVVDRISNKMSAEASIIIDILNSKVVKNRFGDQVPDDEVLAHYMGKYSDLCTKGLQIWADQLGVRSKNTGLEITEAAESPND